MVTELKINAELGLEAQPPRRLSTPQSLLPFSYLHNQCPLQKTRFPGAQEVINLSHSSPPKGYFLEIEMDSERIWANL